MNSEKDTAPGSGGDEAASPNSLLVAQQAAHEAQRKATQSIAQAQASAQEAIQQAMKAAGASITGLTKSMGVDAAIAEEVERSVGEAQEQVREAQRAIEGALESVGLFDDSSEKKTQDAPASTKSKSGKK